MPGRFAEICPLRLATVGLGILAFSALFETRANRPAYAQSPAAPRREPGFEQEIVPLLKAHCLKCHGSAKREGGLDLRTKTDMLKGGDSGPALVPGAVDESLLYTVLSQGEMPPKPNARLTVAQVALIKDWVVAGAPAPHAGAAPPAVVKGGEPGRPHWAFQGLARPNAPPVRDRVRTPVDAFVLAKLEAKGLRYAPDADVLTLVRRAYLDLIGLPPTPEEVEAFVHDPRPDAYERLVDRLLASPHFGERWGRHWLDGAGFSDILGCDNDAGRIKLGENKWRYRDYVVHALNEDKPFDRFVTEQLAGDELVDWRAARVFDETTRSLLVATGFLRNSADDTDENELNTPDIRHGVLQRTGEVLVGNLLGLTFQCAKCHDHKYEPITQRDYYRFLALLQPAFNPQSWVQPGPRQLADVAPAEQAAIERANAELDRRAGEMSSRLAALRRPYEERLANAKLANLPEPIRADVRAAVQTPADKRNDVFKYLAAKFEAALKVTPEEVAASLDDKDKAAVAAAEREIASLKSQRRAWGHLQVVYDVGPPSPTYLLRRGNYLTPGAPVPAGFLRVLSTSDAATEPKAPDSAGATSGRRLALAHWLNDERSPAGALAARVRVNRIWQHLFGRGIVETPDNFGVTGAEPTHRELLEWLASEFCAGGKRLKPFVKLLMTSTAYRQAAVETDNASSADASTLDPDNQLLGRMRLRRLESEAVRDRILAVSGTLDRTMGGAPIPVEPRPDGTFVIPEKGLPTPTSQWRRSLYLLARRNYHPSLLDVFDQPDLATNCTRRASSAVVLQSLTMLNDGFVLEQAGHLAARVTRAAAGPNPQQKVAATFAITLGRPPSAPEVSWCVALLDRQEAYHRGQKLPSDQAALKALTSLCHTLLNTSEFLYIP
ncbi:MAG: PSD1 and planctomycete cytochrome C domain-containing protein [Isosphaeraceae bacterium]|nr:PSD1 and planctomycete cytochrome C domain-containing protein [Isosphaeraceae bacterium]